MARLALLKSMATVSGFTFVSRIMGFVRQILIAGVIGASQNPAADAFMVAFRMPNMFRRLLAEGAFHAAFIPLFQGAEAEADKQAAKEFAEDILAWLIVILTGLSALVMIFTPSFIGLVATGFTDDEERLSLTVLYTRIMFPYLACMSIVGILSGMLHASKKFAAAAAAPVLLNLCLITGVLLTANEGAAVTGQAAAISVMIAGVLQVCALLWAAHRSSLLLRLRRPKVTQRVRRMVALGTPGFIAASALQVNGIVGVNIASRTPGANSWLFYADQLYQLPLAMIGIAMGVVLMPTLGRAIKAGQEAEARRLLSNGIEMGLFFALPAAAALIAMPAFLAGALFQDLSGDLMRLLGGSGSAINALDVQQIGLVLMVFGMGLPAFILQKILASAFFSREDTKTPMRFALVAIALNATISIGLFPLIGFVSVAIGTSIAAWTEVSCLGVTLLKRKFLILTKALLVSLLKLASQALVLGVALASVTAEADMLRPYFFGQDWVMLGVLVVLSVASYGLSAVAVGAVDRDLVLGPLRKLSAARK